MISIIDIEVTMKRTYSGYETENFEITRCYCSTLTTGTSRPTGFYVVNKKTREKTFYTSLRDAKKYLINIGEKV